MECAGSACDTGFWHVSGRRLSAGSPGTWKTLGLPVVDMTKMTKALYETLGKDETVYLHAWTSDKAASVDNTHTNVWGARVNACLCLNEVKESAGGRAFRTHFGYG